MGDGAEEAAAAAAADLFFLPATAIPPSFEVATPAPEDVVTAPTEGEDAATPAPVATPVPDTELNPPVDATILLLLPEDAELNEPPFTIFWTADAIPNTADRASCCVDFDAAAADAAVHPPEAVLAEA